MKYVQTGKLIDRNEYMAIHSWIRYRYGKASVCENKDCKNLSKCFEWALKKGSEYKRDKDCFIQLCKICHIEYDNHNVNILHSFRDADCMNRINEAKFKKVDQISKDGVLIKTWNSASEAGKYLCIDRVGIGGSINKKKPFKNYLWKIHNG